MRAPITRDEYETEIEVSLQELQEAEQKLKKAKTKDGCYIATAVYGSYDCPQVWVLRRYRDLSLADSWYGRMFIGFYYTVSPTIIKCFDNARWFNRFWKKSLERFVAQLLYNGYSDRPYSD